jgi:hypothetical protein
MTTGALERGLIVKTGAKPHPALPHPQPLPIFKERKWRGGKTAGTEKKEKKGIEMADNDFTHIAVKRETQRKAAILAKVLDDTSIYSLVQYWADQEWKAALDAGLVTDKMLEKRSKVEGQKSKGKGL